MATRHKIDEAIKAHLQREEEALRILLSRWVYEYGEPAVVYYDGHLIGLCRADAEVGSKPYILYREYVE